MSSYVPGSVSQKEVSDMKRFLDLLQEGTDAGPVAGTVEPTYNQSYTREAPSLSENANDMKRILESFYRAGGEVVEDLRETAKKDPTLREAMSTKETPTGAVIGGWEVRVRLTETKSKKQLKEYDIIDPTRQYVMFERLSLYEAAHAMVRYLNKGLDPEHQKIQEIADLEETYRRNRQDAAQFKRRFERCVELDEMAAADVFEARYQKARAQAIAASDQIKSILDNIR